MWINSHNESINWEHYVASKEAHVVCNPQEVTSLIHNKAQVQDSSMKEIAQESKLIASPFRPHKRSKIKKLSDMHAEDALVPSNGTVEDGIT